MALLIKIITPNSGILQMNCRILFGIITTILFWAPRLGALASANGIGWTGSVRSQNTVYQTLITPYAALKRLLFWWKALSKDETIGSFVFDGRHTKTLVCEIIQSLLSVSILKELLETVRVIQVLETCIILSVWLKTFLCTVWTLCHASP